MEISNGLWVDLKTNQCVTEAPAEGVQIVAPGAEITGDVEAAIKHAHATYGAPNTGDDEVEVAAEVVTEPGPEVEVTAEPEPGPEVEVTAEPEPAPKARK